MCFHYLILNLIFQGYLDSSSHDSNLKTGSKLDLPYWLVKSIYNEKYKFVSIVLPKAYNKFNNEILEADPCVVDLRKMGPHYYDFGVLLVNLVDIDTALAISKSLLWVKSGLKDIISMFINFNFLIFF